MQHKITFKSKGLNCSAPFYLPNNAASAHNTWQKRKHLLRQKEITFHKRGSRKSRTTQTHECPR